MKRLLPLLLLLPTAFAGAGGMTLSVEIPQHAVAEYHRPYVAAWIEKEDNTAVANLAMWYQQARARPNKQGTRDNGSKWLPELRQWWRRSGRSLALPVDGVTGATRPVGVHDITVDAADARLRSLPPGNYRLVVEAAREVGGRELLKIPFAWPPPAAQAIAAQGKSEIGKLTLTLSP